MASKMFSNPRLRRASLWAVSPTVRNDDCRTVHACAWRSLSDPRRDREAFVQEILTFLITLAGFGQLGLLIASTLVPFQLDWKNSLRDLPRLHRQMYWAYGGYIISSWRSSRSVSSASST